MTADNPSRGPTFESFLEQQGIAGEVYGAAQGEAEAWARSRPDCRCSALDVAAYILEKMSKAGSTPSTLKLHKLLYYVQAWSTVWDDGPIFSEPVEAWSFGPVIRTVYAAHEGEFKVERIPGGDPTKLDARERETVDAVINHYAGRNAQYLQDLIRLEGIWSAARAGLSQQNHAGPEIVLARLQEYYGSLGTRPIAGSGSDYSEISEHPAHPLATASNIPLERALRENYQSLYRDRPSAFFVTVFGPVKEKDREGKRPLSQRTQRTWAWFPSLELAQAALRINDGDLHEGEYVEAVVEEIVAGVSAQETREHWFSWDASLQGFVTSEKPRDLAGISHFSIG